MRKRGKQSLLAALLIIVLSLSLLPVKGMAAGKAEASVQGQESENVIEESEESKDASAEIDDGIDIAGEGGKEETTEEATTEATTEEATEEIIEEETTEEEIKLTEEELTLSNLITPLSRALPTGSANDAPSYGQISLVKFVKLANGCMGGIALDSSGAVWTFGYNLYGQLGIGKTEAQQNYYGGMKRIPYFSDNGIKIIDIASSYESRYALSDDGKVYAWGDGGNGAMGNGSSTRTNTTPSQVTGLPVIDQLFVSDSYLNEANVFALAQDGALWAWGYNNSGVLGLGNTSTTTTPVQVPLDTQFTDGTRSIVKVAVGCRSAHLLDNQGDLWITGQDTYGEQGDGTGVSSDKRTFTKMDRTANGLGRVVDIDTSYVRLQVSGDRVVAADENDDVWEWGVTYGDGSAAATRVEKQTPQKIVLAASEVAAVGYTPKPTSVIASEMVCYFIDQHGRPWGWGSGYYFGFGTEGAYTVNNKELIKSTAARQVPTIIGDGDTNRSASDAKFPIYTGGTLYGSLDSGSGYLGYGFNALHPTIYDEKYMLKDASGAVLDTNGKQIKKATATTVNGVSGLTRGKYYQINASGAIISPAVEATPAIDPTDALWINLAFQDVPYIAQMDVTLSAYAFIDADGNLFKWGNDGSGAIAWGWDYEDKYDQNGSLTTGLYDRYTYEVMYMRGAPTVDYAGLSGSISRKVYVEEGDEADNKADITLHVPKSVANESLGADVKSDVTELKYVFIPYDENDAAFNADVSSLSYDEFMGIYNGASVKGDLISSTISSGSDDQDIAYQVNAPENGRIIVFGINSRYVEGTNGMREYENTNVFATSVLVDNVYTKTLLTHKGVGQHTGESDVELYAPTMENVVKTNDDSADTGEAFDSSLYGLPLDKDGNVIGTTVDGSGNVTVVEAPRYGYDTVKIQSYEAVGNTGLPGGITPYWKFKEYLDDQGTDPQPEEKDIELTSVDYKITTAVNASGDEEEIYYAHDFFYEHDPEYWTKIDGSKTWDDMDDAFGFRPDSIELTLEQYERNTSTGAKGNYIKDVAKETITPDGDGNWTFDFGSQMSYEYTYEVVETAITNYTTVITYKNLAAPSAAKNEDFSEVAITNTLELKPLKLNKVDTSENPVTSDTATFTMVNADTGKKVLDASGNEVTSLDFTTDLTDGFISIPFQKAGTYIITETKAPSGYNLLTQNILLTVGTDASVTAKIGNTVLEQLTLSEEEAKEYSYAYNIVNKEAAELPKAGGMGTPIYTVLGLLLMLGAVYFLKRNKTGIVR